LSEKELHVHGAFRYKSGDYQVAIDVLEARTIPLKKLITNIFDFEKNNRRMGSGQARTGYQEHDSGLWM
jgi:D-xylulose reductase